MLREFKREYSNKMEEDKKRNETKKEEAARNVSNSWSNQRSEFVVATSAFYSVWY